MLYFVIRNLEYGSSPMIYILELIIFKNRIESMQIGQNCDAKCINSTQLKHAERNLPIMQSIYETSFCSSEIAIKYIPFWSCLLKLMILEQFSKRNMVRWFYFTKNVGARYDWHRKCISTTPCRTTSFTQNHPKGSEVLTSSGWVEPTSTQHTN